MILATNVAETSLTVPGIKYVVDAGSARISRYSARSKIQRLPIEAISQASAKQRAGRAGRTSDGIAIRLYSEEDHDRRPEYTDPEILRTNLAAVILQMLSLGLGDIESFPFLTPPDSRGIKDGLDLLARARRGARRRDHRVGRELTRLPLDPRLARMVLEAKRHGVTREVIAIVAGISIQDPRERPLEKRAQADQSHARFTDPTSDFLTLLNLWNHLEDRRRELSGNAFRRLVRSEFLNYLRVREWLDVVRQVERALELKAEAISGLRRDASADGRPGHRYTSAADAIHRSILSGLLSHIGLRDLQKSDYAGSRQTRFVIFPGSALAKKQPDAIMSAELVETSRLFARMNAKIDPAWAEPIAGELLKRNFSEPHWERKQGAVVGYEKVTLYGVPIIPRRKVQYSRVDLPYARDLFIRNALVDGDWDARGADFQKANAALRKRLAEVEERTRRRDILQDDEALFEFYDRRIPADVASTRDFEGWWKMARTEAPDLLTMSEADLLGDASAPAADDGYPDSWQQGDQTLKLSYRFEPGHPDDGVTVTVPLPLLPGLSPDGFDWQVPGLREEAVTALIKSLPKAIRKNVVPAGDWARRLLADAVPDETGLTAYLAREITAQTHTRTVATDFELERLPPHLRMTFAVADERGKVVAKGTSGSTSPRATPTGSSSATPSNAVGLVGANAPVNSVRPTITGEVERGSTLTATPGTWSGANNVSCYQWQRYANSTWTNIAGATLTTYTLRSPTRATRCASSSPSATPTAASSAASDATVAVAKSPPIATTIPAPSGTAARGASLIAKPGTWEGVGNTYRYQWQKRSGSGTWTNVAGATATSYRCRRPTRARTSASRSPRPTSTAPPAGTPSRSARSPTRRRTTRACRSSPAPPPAAATLSVTTGNWTGPATSTATSGRRTTAPAGRTSPAPPATATRPRRPT